MLDQLLNIVKEHAGESIVRNPSIPNEHNEAAIEETATVIQNQLKEAASKGNLNDIFAIVGQNQNAMNQANPVTSNMTTNLTQALQSKFGVDSKQAGSIAANLIPQVLQMFSKKTNDPGDNSIDMNSIMKSLGGGEKSGGVDFNEILKKFNSGGVDLSSISGMFK